MAIAAAATFPVPSAPAVGGPSAPPAAGAGFASQIDLIVAGVQPLLPTPSAPSLPLAGMTLSLSQAAEPPVQQAGLSLPDQPAAATMPRPAGPVVGGDAVDLPADPAQPISPPVANPAGDADTTERTPAAQHPVAEQPAPEGQPAAADNAATALPNQPAAAPAAPVSPPTSPATPAPPTAPTPSAAPAMAPPIALGLARPANDLAEPKKEGDRAVAAPSAHKRGARTAETHAAAVTPPEGGGASLAALPLYPPAAPAPAAARPSDAEPGPEPSDRSARGGTGTIDTGAGIADRSPAAPLATPAPAPGGAQAAGAPPAFVPQPAHPVSAATAAAAPGSLPGGEAPGAANAATPVVHAHQIGRSLGVEIARRVADGGDMLTIRLDPAELGRIEVRLSFDGHGSLRAVMSADSPAALDLLRRDSGQLGQALADAGIRADGQSLQFDSRQSGSGSHGPWQRPQPPESGGSQNIHAASEEQGVIAHPLRTSGNIDLMA